LPSSRETRLPVLLTPPPPLAAALLDEEAIAAAVEEVFLPQPFLQLLLPPLRWRLLLDEDRETRPRTAAPANAKSTAELFLVCRPALEGEEEAPSTEALPGAAAAAEAEEVEEEAEGREEALARRALE